MRHRHIAIFLIGFVLSINMNAQEIQKVSVLDISSDYGVPAVFIQDTNVFISYIMTQTDNYIAKASTCANINTRAQSMIITLRNDYPQRDGLIMLSSQKGVHDFALYELKLQQLSMTAARYSQYYLSLEQTRMKVSANEALSIEEASAKQRQDDLELRANALKDEIDMLHDSITDRCTRNRPTDKNLAKEYKDIYYAYVSIYNQKSILPSHSSENTINELSELQWMQENLLTNILCDSSFSLRISQFPQQLKNHAEPNATDIFRSYLRNFTHNSAPINFSTIRGYRNYVTQLNDIMTVQQHYMQAIDLRDSIQQYSDSIIHLYSKGYGDIAKAYQRHLSMINTMPAFNRIDESISFITDLQNFITMQHIYLKNYDRIEKMRRRSEAIVRNCPKNCLEISATYQYYVQNQNLIPSFTTIDQYEEYDQRLSEYEQMQDNFETIIRLRDSIDRTDRYLTESPDADKVFINGYKAIKKEASITTSLQSEEEAQAAIRVLRDFIFTQETCMKIQRSREAIAANDKLIDGYEKRYANIYIAYKTLRKDYEYTEKIQNLDDMRSYHIKLIETASIQERFINILQSDQAASINEKMYGMRDLQQIKRVFHL
ncbi:MAG: hypothetical protein IJ764_01790 [Bacteroidales bacterium]|nr:hypothetical protein [Bacteroidales bacterium]